MKEINQTIIVVKLGNNNTIISNLIEGIVTGVSEK
jgi:hypothetical protein